ncbi:MAG: GNAT family N-acetyltransferase [Planctomycetes bacterium]|nr:GNAT family N-acetyltransferase [Planctomycetota bacterium]
MELTLRRLSADARADFMALMQRGSEESAACLCTAYHGAAPEDAPACRNALMQGQPDGYLLYRDGAAAAWCQCGPWDSFKVFSQRKRPGSWVITCMVVAPHARGQGLVHAMLAKVFDDLKARGIKHVLACAHRLGPAYSSPLAELPEAACIKAGMTIERDDAECPRYEIKL